MPDWQHALRNHLNHALYASSWARESMLQGHPEQAVQALASLDSAILACSEELARLRRLGEPGASASEPTTTVPDQPEAGQAE